ncbi:MAG: hypothetical protein U0670_00155 [Anaerolineae bacterium]
MREFRPSTQTDIRHFCLAILWLCTAILTACAGSPTATITPTCTPESAWGGVITLANAGLTAPPALAVHANFMSLAYVTSDQTGARQVMRRWIDGHLTDPVTLTLPPIQPRDQLTFPALDNNVFVVWIDLDEVTHVPAVFSALVTPTTEILRGPLRLSAENEQVYDLSAALMSDGSLWVAWSGATSNEPAVWLRKIDNEGRPALPIRFASDALHPALIRLPDDTLLLLYEEGEGENVVRARIADGVLLESARITARVSRTPGTLIESVYGAADSTHGYLFWNLTRDDGHRETWFSTGELDAANWSAPALFEPPYQWVRPLAENRTYVQLAAVDSTGSGDQIGVASMAAGEFVGFEPVTRCTPVIDPPALFSNGGQLILAWSQPHTAAPADLQMTIQPN